MLTPGRARQQRLRAAIAEQGRRRDLSCSKRRSQQERGRGLWDRDVSATVSFMKLSDALLAKEGITQRRARKRAKHPHA